LKVILLEDVKKVGKKDEIVDVSDGYANNYLIKNKLAIQYTKASNERLKQELDTKALEEDLFVKEMIKWQEELEKNTITFEVQTGKDDQVFGQISSKQIKDKLMDMGYDIKKNNIVIDKSIDSLGIHNVKLQLHKKVIVNLKISLIKK
jgi:large subunit ribosomal protein L9